MRFSALFYAGFILVGITLVDHAHGQSGPLPQSDSAMSEIRVPAPAKSYWTLRRTELDALRGTYLLSNGWLLKVRPNTRMMMAQIDDRPAMSLLPMSPDKFVSLDGNMSMEFNLGDSGDEMVLAYVPDPRTAQVVIVRTSLAQR